MMTDKASSRASFTHERADLRADNPLYERAGLVRPTFEASATGDAERAARRESFMVKRQQARPMLRPSPSLALGSDGAAFDQLWDAERHAARQSIHRR